MPTVCLHHNRVLVSPVDGIQPPDLANPSASPGPSSDHSPAVGLRLKWFTRSKLAALDGTAATTSDVFCTREHNNIYPGTWYAFMRPDDGTQPKKTHPHRYGG